MIDLVWFDSSQLNNDVFLDMILRPVSHQQVSGLFKPGAKVSRTLTN